MSAGRGSGYRPVLYKSGCASREKDAWMRRGGCGSAVNVNRIRWRILGQSIMAKTLGGSSCEPVSCEARSICRGSRHAGRVEGMKLTTGSLIGGRRGPCEMGSGGGWIGWGPPLPRSGGGRAAPMAERTKHCRPMGCKQTPSVARKFSGGRSVVK